MCGHLGISAVKRGSDVHHPIQAQDGEQAAIEVLRSASKPLKAAEIARRVLDVTNVRLERKTPAATVAAVLAVENGKPDGLFVRVVPRTYALRKSGES
jgi:HB1, ASXL, restriction endonuclease HTH domain